MLVFDDAYSEIYGAQLVREESTATVMAALQEVVEQRGVFCSLYTDAASHFVHTPVAGGMLDPEPAAADRPSAGATECRTDCGPFAPGTRSLREDVWDLAGAAAAGVTSARDPNDGRGQPVSARGVDRVS